MKNFYLAWIGALCCTLAVNNAQAERLRQPLSVQPIGFDYNNYQDDVAPSPSDQPAAADAVEMESDAVDAETSPEYYPPSQSPSCGCAPAVSCGGCAGGCCRGRCNSGCGGLSGLHLRCRLCDCCLGEPYTLMKCLHGDCERKVNIGGWFSAGYHSQSNGLFNTRPDRVNLQQGWVYVEKVADPCDGPFGFRADFMYGMDSGDTQAFGNPPGTWDFENGWGGNEFGWALPQLYGEVAVRDWRVKAGHFYTLVGYEVVQAPDNFFYSHALSFYNSQPFTHTGVVATRSCGCNLDIHMGWTLGWDTGFAQLNQGNNWLGGFSYRLGDNATLTYISTAGNFGWRGEDGYEHSIVFDTNLTDKLNYVLMTDYLRVNGTGEDNFGLVNYLIYSLNDCVGIGGRIEWWKGDALTDYLPHGSRAAFPVGLPAGSHSYYEATAGVNVRPHANLIFRPEVRVDWSPVANYSETYFGVDAILTY